MPGCWPMPVAWVPACTPTLAWQRALCQRCKAAHSTVTSLGVLNLALYMIMRYLQGPPIRCSGPCTPLGAMTLVHGHCRTVFRGLSRPFRRTRVVARIKSLVFEPQLHHLGNHVLRFPHSFVVPSCFGGRMRDKAVPLARDCLGTAPLRSIELSL